MTEGFDPGVIQKFYAGLDAYRLSGLWIGESKFQNCFYDKSDTGLSANFSLIYSLAITLVST